jgi:histone acetyltransferase (RNA polymerase elongator complex component)
VGHPTDKIEVRIIGGNWSSYPKKYKEWFVKRCFEACNNRKDETLKKLRKEMNCENTELLECLLKQDLILSIKKKLKKCFYLAQQNRN